MSRSKANDKRTGVGIAGERQSFDASSAHAKSVWRPADELLGTSPYSEREAKADAFELPDDVAHAIAAATKIRTARMAEFRTGLTKICGDVSSQCTLLSLYKARRPLALLKRVSRSARQLSQDLFRLTESENVTLDGTLIALLPRVVLRARFHADKIEVVRQSWTFLDCEIYAHLLAGLAECAEVAAGKKDISEVGPRLGVRVSFNQERNDEIRREHYNLPSVRNVPLSILIRRLSALVIDEASGRLTLWKDRADDSPKGTLPTVLAILRPYLSDAIPEKLNYRTLHRYLDKS